MPMAKVLGAAARPGPRVPARVGGEHLGDELRRAVQATPSRRSTAGRSRRAACRTRARGRSRRTTATAATWSSRSARRTSAAETSTGASTWPGSRTWSRRRRSAPSRSSSRRGPSRGSAACFRRPRSAARSPRSGGSRRARTAPRRAGTRSSATSTRCSTSSSWSRAETGLPVGIKSAVGNLEFWDSLVKQMEGLRRPGGRGVDFVNIDGGEGGTGAAPLVFTDSVAYPVPDRLRAGLRPVRPGRAHRRRGLPRRRQARPARERRRGLRAGRRRRPGGQGGDVRAGVHPGAAVPHRPLSDRCRHPEAAAGARPGPGLEVASGCTTTWSPCAATCSRSPRRSGSATPA